MTAWRFSNDLHCPDCDIHYSDPSPARFSFNSPVGACEKCRGFGRVIGVDYGLVIPDESKSLGKGAVKPFQTASFDECQDDIEKYAKRRGVALDIAWRDLPPEHRRWVIEGDEGWVSWHKTGKTHWYGVARFFEWLETKAYKMHIRVLLSRYRAYTPCADCDGARLKPESHALARGHQGRGRRGARPREALSPARHAVEPRRAGGAPGPVPARRDAAAHRAGADLLRAPRPARPAGRGDGTAAGGSQRAASLRVRGGPGLPHARPPVAHALRRRGAAHQPHHGAGHLAREHALRAGRALHRPAPARHGPRDRRDEAAARRGQFARGGGARPADHAGGRPPARHGAGAGRARRRDRVLRHARRAQAREHGDGGVPLGPEAGGCGRVRLPAASRPIARDGSATPPRRHRAQPQGRRRRVPAQPPRVRDGRLGVGEIHPHPGRAAPGAPQAPGQADGIARRLPRDARRGANQRRGVRGPVAHRPHHAIQPRELRGRVRRHPRDLRPLAGIEDARLHGRHLQLQLRQRALPHLQRQRLRARGDAVPLRRVPALPGLQRHGATATRCSR